MRATYICAAFFFSVFYPRMRKETFSFCAADLQNAAPTYYVKNNRFLENKINEYYIKKGNEKKYRTLFLHITKTSRVNNKTDTEHRTKYKRKIDNHPPIIIQN